MMGSAEGAPPNWFCLRGSRCRGKNNFLASKTSLRSNLPSGAVQLVGAGAGNDVGGRAGAAAEFGVGTVSEDAKFG